MGRRRPPGPAVIGCAARLQRKFGPEVVGLHPDLGKVPAVGLLIRQILRKGGNQLLKLGSVQQLGVVHPLPPIAAPSTPSSGKS